MRLLVLGGPGFLGRALIDTALTRGQTNSDLYPEIERLIGDRDG